MKFKICLKKNYICPICKNILKTKDASIQCDFCDEWIHLKCSSLKKEEFDLLSLSETKWYCSRCIFELLPLHDIDNNELLLDNLGIHCTNLEDFSIIPNATSNAFTRECQKLSINSQNKPLIDEDENFYTQINSQYYDILEFNQIKHNMDSSFNLIHTNLASISKHHDDLELTLSLLKTKFDIIGITEHKIKRKMKTPSQILIYQDTNLLYLIAPRLHMVVQDSILRIQSYLTKGTT